MSRSYEVRSVVSRVALAASALLLGAPALGQAPEEPARRLAEVTANDVYVRSGASLNYYPISKLRAGDRVTVLGEEGNWYEIIPPEGAFSLISGQYVDTVDNKFGVVNGNNVRVRAGSQLNNSKYTVQTMLSKGAEVQIIGENPDGFLRIKPPKGATLWISRDYVELVPDELVRLERETGAPVEMTDAETEKAGSGADQPPQENEQAATDETARPSPLAALPPTPRRKQLEEIDAATRAELAKPILERKLNPLAERYRLIMEQDEDEFARRYARHRVRQLDDMLGLTNTIRKMRELDEQAESLRRQHRTARAEMYETMPPAPVGLDARGELRVSALYPPGASPRRYRLVDPTTPNARTIGYVEIPLDSTLKVEDYLGRFVGVRAGEKRLLAGGVSPVPIYVVSELVILEPPAGEPSKPDKD
jgi:hypothetical protein